MKLEILFAAFLLLAGSSNARFELVKKHEHHELAKRQEQSKRSAKCVPRKSSTTTTSNQPGSTTTSSSNSKSTPNNVGVTPGVTGMIHVQVDRCGNNGATPQTTSTTSPNGSLNWMNCGLETPSGWNPPRITLANIVSVNLTVALQSSDSPFNACSPYLWAFEQYGKQVGVPPIILASFALQESSCIPSTVGGAGEQGLMQITKDKCGKAPNGNCKDVGYNVQTGAEYFASTLADNHGDLLRTIGFWNGWSLGLTVEKATAAAKTKCCTCQNNLDYLFQFLGGWVLNIDAYKHNLGKYHNLDVCSKS